MFVLARAAFALGGVIMGMGIRASICSGFLYGLTVAANAAVVPTFTVTPTTINAGDQSTLDLVLNLTADPGYFNAVFTGGSVTLFSDFGPSQVFNITAGGISKSFSTSFTYPAGNYNPAYSFTANYSEQYQRWEQTGGYYINQGYYVYYSCGFLGSDTCWYWVDRWVFQPTYGYVTYTNYTGNTGSGSLALTSVNPVPLPAALPLFATVVAGGGLIAWRRRRKAAPLLSADRTH